MDRNLTLALTRAAVQGSNAIEEFLDDTIVALADLGYADFESAARDGLICSSEYKRLKEFTL